MRDERAGEVRKACGCVQGAPRRASRRHRRRSRPRSTSEWRPPRGCAEPGKRRRGSPRFVSSSIRKGLRAETGAPQGRGEASGGPWRHGTIIAENGLTALPDGAINSGSSCSWTPALAEATGGGGAARAGCPSCRSDSELIKKRQPGSGLPLFVSSRPPEGESRGFRGN